MLKIITICLGSAAMIWAEVDAVQDYSRYSIDGRDFDVPRDYIFDETIAWLPASEDDSFVFLFEPNPNPEAIPPYRIVAQPLKGRCPGGSSEMLKVACGEVAALKLDDPKFEARSNELGSWSSDLFVVQKDPKSGRRISQQVAYCQKLEPNPVKPEETTRCTTFWSYKGVFLTFSFDEENVSEMPALRVKAESMLDRWLVSSS